jgi:hypothetical protein
VGNKGGGGGRGEKWPKPCMHIWIIKEKKIKVWKTLKGMRKQGTELEKIVAKHIW